MIAHAATRRTFLTAGTLGAASLWAPSSVKGFSATDIRERTEGEVVQGNISKWDLDTPALCVDLDKFEANIAKAQAALTRSGIAARPHAKTHKCAAIARKQLAAGAIGICTAKLGEAEALFAQGIEKMCMTTSNPSVAKIRRAMLLRKKNPHFIQPVDYAPN